MLLTIGAPGVTTDTAVCVVTGIWSPTKSVAGWLSTTTIDGFDNTLTVVTVCKASRIACGFASEPTRKLKPGRTRLRTAVVAPAIGLLLAEPVSGLRPRFLLCKKNCTP